VRKYLLAAAAAAGLGSLASALTYNADILRATVAATVAVVFAGFIIPEYIRSCRVLIAELRERPWRRVRFVTDPTELRERLKVAFCEIGLPIFGVLAALIAMMAVHESGLWLALLAFVGVVLAGSLASIVVGAIVVGFASVIHHIRATRWPPTAMCVVEPAVSFGEEDIEIIPPGPRPRRSRPDEMGRRSWCGYGSHQG
jgi:hypothetical protein